jgi:hypothetical protein
MINRKEQKTKLTMVDKVRIDRFLPTLATGEAEVAYPSDNLNSLRV